MAEVKITITAEDQASAVFERLRASVEPLKAMAGDIAVNLSVGIDTAPAMSAIAALTGDVGSLRFDGSVYLDVSEALASAYQVRAAIDSIPDVSYKAVVVQYFTEASPRMPFTDGIGHIKEMMGSLPEEGSYVLKFPNAGQAQTGEPQKGQPSSLSQTMTFSPTININSGDGKSGRQLAEGLDSALADMWRHDRSALKKAMKGGS